MPNLKRVLLGLYVTSLIGFVWLKISVISLDPWDESFYIRSGMINIRNWTWAPLYQLWYRVLSILFGAHPMQLFFLGHFLLILIFLGLAFLTIRRLGGSQNAALIAVTALASWAPFMDEAVKVNHFNIAASLALFLLASRLLATTAAFVLGLGLLLGLYIRQDNLVVAVGFLAYGIYSWWKTRGPVPWPLIALALIVPASLLAKSPFDSRGFYAWADHFYWAEGFSYEGGRNLLIQKVFGDVNSISGALFANPGAFAHYIWINWTGPRWPLDLLAFYPVTGLGCLLAAAGLVPLKRAGQPAVLGLFIIFLVLAGIRTLIDISLFEPNFRYFFEFVVLVFIFLASRIEAGVERIWIAPILTLALLVGSQIGPQAIPSNSGRVVRAEYTQMISRLSEIGSQQRKRWFAARSIPFYLENFASENFFAPNWDKPPEPHQVESYLQLIKSKKVDVIVIDRANLTPLFRDFGPRGPELIRTTLVSSCYDTVEENAVAKIYLRKTDCSSD